MVDETTNDQDRALEALRTWKARSGDRDRLVLAAKAAGAPQTAISEAGGIDIKTVRTILNTTTKEATMPTTTDDRLSGLHHPNFIRDLGPDVPAPRFMFRPFTGTEPRPTDDDVVPREILRLEGTDRETLWAEYCAAEHEWRTAKFEAAARPALEEARPVWGRYRERLEDWRTCWSGFDATEDGKWKARALQLHRCQQATTTAAGEWDEQAAALARLEETEAAKFSLRAEAPGLDEVAARIGVDITAWPIRPVADYAAEGDSPTVAEVRAQVAAQVDELRAVAAMTGEPTAPKLTGSDLLHAAIEYMVDRQAVRPHPDERTRHMAETDADSRAHIVVRLYAGLKPDWKTGRDAGEVRMIADAYRTAATMVETFKARHR